MELKSKEFTDRFWAKVKKTDGCWLWTGATNARGYGKIRIPKTRELILAHRASWILAGRNLPRWSDHLIGLCVLHECDTPLCVRPEHLFLGTETQNAQDRDAKGRGSFIAHAGSANPNSILTEEAVRFIRSLPRPIRCSELAGKFGVRERTIRAVVYGESWRDIK